MFTLCAYDVVSMYVMTTDVTSCNTTYQFVTLYCLVFGVICKSTVCVLCSVDVEICLPTCIMFMNVCISYNLPVS